MFEPTIGLTERRAAERFSPGDSGSHAISVSRTAPVLPLADAQVLNASTTGVAISTRVPLQPGSRLSFAIAPGMPRIIAQVLAREDLPDGSYRVRCRCVLGAFERP